MMVTRFRAVLLAWLTMSCTWVNVDGGFFLSGHGKIPLGYGHGTEVPYAFAGNFPLEVLVYAITPVRNHY